MDIERQFEDLGVDAVLGVELMNLLTLSQSDFYDPGRFMRFRDVISYFKNVPDKNYLINKVTLGKPVDKLDHVWGYVELSKQKNKLNTVMQEKLHKIETLEDLGDERTFTLVNELNTGLVDLRLESKRIDEQIQAYEN